MEIETYGKPKKKNFGLIVILIFVGILGFLVYTSFYNPDLGRSISSVTGNVIGGIGSNSGSIEINAILTSPEKIRINNKIEKIELKVLGSFIIGKEKFDLDESSIVIEDFDGYIIIAKNNLTANGKAKKVFVEGIPITSNSDMKVSFNNDYSYLKLTNFYLDALSYKTSGIVRLNNEKAVINLENENFRIEKFNGNLEISNKFKINGNIQESNFGVIDIKARTVNSKENSSTS